MAWTATVKPNADTVAWKRQSSLTSSKAILDGTAPAFGGKALKMCYVTVTCVDADVYSSNGVIVDLLSALPGWTAVLGVIGLPYYNSNSTAAWEAVGQAVDPNNVTTTNRKLTLVTPAAVEVANGRVMTGCVLPMIVLGY